jgi:hypothetical protein
VWVTVHNAATDLVVASLFQPSLSSRNHDKPSGGRTSAFLLQPLSQPCIVVSFGSDLFTGIKGCTIIKPRCDGQVALSHVNAYHALVGFWRWVCYLKLKGDEQVKLLAWFVIPELGRADMRSLLQ